MVLSDWQYWLAANRWRIREDAPYVPPEEVTVDNPMVLNQAFEYRMTLTVGPQKWGKGPCTAFFTAAEGCGMDVAHLKLMAFVIGAFWAGMAGNLFAAKMTIISPSSFTFWESVVVFAVVILSGGSQIGVLLGTFLIVALPEMFRDFASARMLVFGLAMMIMMVVRPQGLLPPSPRRYDVRRLLRRTRDFSSPVAPRTARKEGAA